MKFDKTNSAIPDIWLRIIEEAKKNAGEDNYCFSFGSTAALLGAFDGCGGAGAQRHDCYGGHTEAYISSRLCSGAFYDTFQEFFPNQGTTQSQRKAFLDRAIERCSVTLSTYRPTDVSLTGGVKGSMVRSLPSTAAMVLVQMEPDGGYTVSAIWAGDSRCYLLTKDGLGQLTKDDTSVPDPMDNLYEDGVLKNILFEGKQLNLHVSSFRINEPFLVLTATDGCFGYYTTPMEFEGLILQCLTVAKTPALWEEYMDRLMGKVAGDDYTMVLAGYGFRDFAELQAYFRPRAKHMQKTYLEALQELPTEQREPRMQMWEQYKREYMRYLEED